MKKIYVVLLMLLITVGGFSQKVKIKKNIISLDDVEVGTTEKYKNKDAKEEGYVYSDFKGENKITLVGYYFGTGIGTYFMVKPNFAKDTAEIKMEYLYFTLSEHNALTDLLIKKYNFFDKNGMNIDNIKKYVSTEQEAQIPIIQENIRAEKRLKNEMEKMNIRVQADGTIVKTQNEVIGKFIAPNPRFFVSKQNPIIIKDGQYNEGGKSYRQFVEDYTNCL